jgi:5-methylcytosine-specific restriction enzyme subunit McrC
VKSANLRENRAELIAPLLGRNLDSAGRRRWTSLVRDTGLRFKSRFGTPLPPLSLIDVDGELAIRASGIAGTFRLGDVEWTVVPKFVADDSTACWERSVLALVRRAYPRSFSAEKRSRLGTTSLQLVEVFALAFAEAVELAVNGDSVQAYKTEELEIPVIRGRLLIGKQMQHVISRPHMFSCAVDRMDTDNPVNHLLRWAADRFAELARDGFVRQALWDAKERLPPIQGHAILPPVLPVSLAPQYGIWREAVELANLLAIGRGHGSRGAMEGYGFMLDMPRVFEAFVDVSLRDGLARQSDAKWSRVRQSSRVFASPITDGAKSYWSRPDDLVERDGQRVALVDAKYKLLADAEDGTPRRPSNSDVYQMACSLVAHGVSRGLLVYPKVVLSSADRATDLSSGEQKAWRVQLGDRSLVIGAVAIDLLGLESLASLHVIDALLVEHVKSLLSLAG